MERIPFEVVSQMIQCFGKSFHYKDTVISFLVNCGIEKHIAIKYKDEPKFKWAKQLLADLAETETGRVKQRQILQGLYNLRQLPDKDVPSKEEGLSAIRKLKELVNEHSILLKEDKTKSSDRININKQKEKLFEERSQKLNALKTEFYGGFSNSNKQEVGYLLEKILYELFAIHELEYKKPYKTDTQQIDGHFRFEGFDYLVEAKWTASSPTESVIGEFKRKVDTKIESTRGFFFSIAPFTPLVVQQFNGLGAKILLCDGEDLTHIFEGRIGLDDVLRAKIEFAAQYGNIYYKITDYLKVK
ncbi:MAG: restriction endonuclease [Bacteroidota bacterium]